MKPFTLLISFAILLIGNTVAIVKGLQNWEAGNSFELYRGIGHWMSGNAAIGAFILAVFKLPQELKQWRNQAHQEAQRDRDIQASIRIAEAAAEVLESTHRIIDAIQFITNPFSRSSEGNPSESDSVADKFQKMINSRYESIHDNVKRFFDAKIKARMFFDENVVQLVEEISKLFHLMQVDAEMSIAGMRSRERIPTYEEATNRLHDLDKVRKKRLDEIQNQLIERLRKYLVPSDELGNKK